MPRTTTVLPSALGTLSSLPLAQWVETLGLPGVVLTRLLEYGAEETFDLVHLERAEIAELCSGLKLVQKRKLQGAVEALHSAAAAQLRQQGQVWTEAPAAAKKRGGDQEEEQRQQQQEEDARPRGSESRNLSPSFDRVASPPEGVQRPPPATRMGRDEVSAHVSTLRQFAGGGGGGGGVTAAAAVRALHACWASCVVEPALRPRLLPSLFAIAQRAGGGAVAREAALALIFLAFSLSGTTIKEEPMLTPATVATQAAGQLLQGRTVVILGWLGSQNDEFADIAQYYRQTYPDARIVTSVGGCDRWARSEDLLAQSSSGGGSKAAAAAAAAGAGTSTLAGDDDSPPLFAEGATAPWPAAAACEEQLWGLADAILPSAPDAAAPRVLFHLFSNNGFMLYARLLRHLQVRAGAGDIACLAALQSGIEGVIFDSTPDPAYDPPLLKLVAVQSLAAVLKKESIGALTMRDIAPRTLLRGVVEAACEHGEQKQRSPRSADQHAPPN
jgi:hypothetical protein